MALAVAARLGLGRRRRSPGARPIVLVGIDGADWLAIDRLVARGRLPTFARLKQRGRTGILRATPPLLSPIIWTTIATGRRPEDHRVLDFMVDLPSGGQAPVTVFRASRRRPVERLLGPRALGGGGGLARPPGPAERVRRHHRLGPRRLPAARRSRGHRLSRHAWFPESSAAELAAPARAAARPHARGPRAATCRSAPASTRRRGAPSTRPRRPSTAIRSPTSR